MPLDRKLISLTAPVATGSVTYSGVGFQGKAGLFFCACAAADGTHSGIMTCCGAATASGSGNQWVLATGSTEFNGGTRLATSDAGQSHATTHCVCMLASGAPTIMKEAQFTGWTADGLTLNWTTADATAGLQFFVLVLGGSDLTNVKCGSHTLATANGNVATTGVGFQPDALIFVTPGTSVAAENNTDGRFAFGAAARLPSITQGCVSYFEDGGTTSMTCANHSFGTRVISMPSTAASTTAGYAASLNSFDADGFTLNYTVSTATASRVGYYLALKGGQYKVGAETEATTNTSKATTGMGFAPRALLYFGSIGNMVTDVASTTNVNQGYVLGATDGTAESCIGGYQNDGNADSYASRIVRAAKLAAYIKETTKTVCGEADCTLDADGFTLAWTNTDTAARRFFYLGMGDAGAAPAVLPRIYAPRYHN